MSVQFKTVDEFAVGQRLDNYLLKHLKGVPKSHIYRVIRKGINTMAFF
jgi:23S rRNA pseudouridine955/2504/2580 synthase